MRKFLASVAMAAAAAAAGPASAAIILTLVAADGTVPQSGSNPCVIADTNCPQNPILFTNAPNGDFTDLASPTYTYVAGAQTQNLTFGITVFDIAVDSSVAQGTDTLVSFLVQTRPSGSVDPTAWTTVAQYTGGTAGNIGSPINNGNGFADYLLQTVDLTSVANQSQLRFVATLDNETGGPESFFISVVAAQVPVPGTLALFGLGIAGLGMAARRRSRT